MSTTYNGSAAGGPLNAVVSITIPADGVDTLGVASVNTPLQKAADYLEAVRQATAYACFSYVGNPGNAASTNYFAWAASSQGAVAANPTAGANGQTRHIIPFAGVFRKIAIRTTNATVGGTIIIAVFNQSVGVNIATITLNAGTAAGTFTAFVAGTTAIALGDVVEVQIQNQGGVTTSLGLSLITLGFAFA